MGVAAAPAEDLDGLIAIEIAELNFVLPAHITRNPPP
ncbi:hypothetical protein LCGC14_3122560 [marine sediment metagenome]|uniref:Uncharacterized protein n=1 Tax=marine sediment metagenome TaxID=412755 RepID=A0A0F8W237_9ZZZZ